MSETDMRSIRLGDSVREMVEAGETREEQDAVIAAAARFSWYGEDCREVYGLSAREWAVLTREQLRVNHPKRELSPAEMAQRREAAPKGGRPRKPEKTGETGETGLSQRTEGEEEQNKINPEVEEPLRTSVLIPSISSDFGTWARMQGDPVEVALAASGEGDEKRRSYGARLAKLRAVKGKEEGARLFVEECAAFVAEVAAGEPVRNKGAALNKRLVDLVARLSAAPVPVEVAPAKVSPSPKVEAAPVPSEHDPAPSVEVEKVEEENPAPPFPMPEPVEETPEQTDAVSLALRACNGGEDSREKVAGLLAVFEHITAWGEPKFRELCARYGETNESRTPNGLVAYLREGVPAEHWAKAERAARR